MKGAAGRACDMEGGKYTVSARVHMCTHVCVYERAISKPPSVPPTQLE